MGVIFAAGIGGLHTFEEEAGYYALNQDKGPKYSPFFIPKMIADMAAGLISMNYGYRGPNYATVSACASSTHALIDAFNCIRLGKADGQNTEVLQGLNAGQSYVKGGSFVLKSELGKATAEHVH